MVELEFEFECERAAAGGGGECMAFRKCEEIPGKCNVISKACRRKKSPTDAPVHVHFGVS
jgi:hypothetical protein